MFDPAELVETGRKLACSDVAGCTDDELFAAAVGLERLRSLVEVGAAHALAELDSRKATDARYGMRTASWVASQAGVAPGPVRGRLRVGRTLHDHFDVVDRAVSDGEISFDHAKALTDTTNPRSTDALVGAQDQIVALADGATFDQFKRDVAALAEVADSDGAEPDLTTNTLKMPVTIDDTVRLDGTFDAAAGLTLRTAVNRKADEPFRRFTRDRDRPRDTRAGHPAGPRPDRTDPHRDGRRTRCRHLTPRRGHPRGARQ